MVDKTQKSKRYFSYAEYIQLPPPLTVMGAKACWGNQPIKMVSLVSLPLSQAIVNQADMTPISTLPTDYSFVSQGSTLLS